MSASLDGVGGRVIADAPEKAIKSSLPPTQAHPSTSIRCRPFSVAAILLTWSEYAPEFWSVGR
jgi:hypothetical protein